MSYKKGFASDNNSGVHPLIMESLQAVNQGHQKAYGNDIYTAEAIEKFRGIFGKETAVYFTFNGTGANVLAIRSVCDSWHSVLCSEVAHINEDECSAPEKITGCKLIALPHVHGKISVDDIAKYLVWLDDEHRAQPRLVSITQSTEMGSVYTIDEIKTITQFCHENNLLVHMDGARISNAVVSLNTDFKSMTKDAGVDIVSFGGTKNGLMMGEAVLFFNSDLAKYTKYFRKQNMQLNSKMRFVAAQFLAYFENDLWRKNATNSNAMAKYLHEKVAVIPQIKVVHPVDANGVFAIIPTKITTTLQEHTPFYIFDEHTNMARWMCSWDTTKEDIDNFVEKLKGLL